MAKSKNVNLGASESQTIDLTDVDTNDLSGPSATPTLDRLREKAEPRPAATTRKPKTTTDAAAVAQSLGTEELGAAYGKTNTRVIKSSRVRTPGMRPLVNPITGQNVEGMGAAERDRLDEEPTNVPRNFDKDGLYRNQIHGDYSHFAKVTNLIDYLGEKTGAAQDALRNHPEHAATLDKIHQILSVATGHLMDARNAHRNGETGLSRINPQTGLAKPIGRQFLKDNKEDAYGARAVVRAIGSDPIRDVNQAIGEPQLRSEGITTQALDEEPSGAVPHYRRAIQHIVTASNLLQGSLASLSSDRTIDAKVKPWNGKYDDRPGNPDSVGHAIKLGDDYANSVASEGSEIARQNEDMQDMAPTEVSELFNRTKKAHEAELKAKIQQAEIHAGLLSRVYQKTFGADIAQRTAEAARKTEELKTAPVIPSPTSLTRGVFSRGTGRQATERTSLEDKIAKTQNASDEDLAKEAGKVSLENATKVVRNSLPTLQQAAKDAHAAGKIDTSVLEKINGMARDAIVHHKNAVDQAAQPIALPDAPTLTYDASRDPRFKPTNALAYERMSPEEKAEERNKFLKNRGQTLAQWQKESAAFEEKIPVIQARDALAISEHKAATARITAEHHNKISGHANNAIDTVSEIHRTLLDAGVINAVEPTEVKPDLTGIPNIQQFGRASQPGRIATREDAISVMQRETEAAQAEASRKAEEEANRKAALDARRAQEGDRGSARDQARALGFYAGDEATARGFLEAGEGVRGTAAVGTKRAEFLSGLAAKGAVEYTATPKPAAPGRAVFIAPGVVQATPASVNPKKAARAQRAAARVEGQAAESARRRLGQQVGTLGLNLEDVTRPEPRPSRRTRGAAEETTADTSGFTAGSLGEDPNLFEKMDESAFQQAKTNLGNIQEFNANVDPVNSVGTTTKVTRRTRK